jgi:hypothetical protein
MAKGASLSTVFLCVLASLCSVSGLPAPNAFPDVPEVIPGPGLPSLESLGLTSRDLYLGNAMMSMSNLQGAFLDTDNFSRQACALSLSRPIRTHLCR